MMDIIGGREKRKRNKKWILEEGRKKERKEGGMEGGREKERKKRNKKGGRNAELSKPEKHTQDSGAPDTLGRGFLTPLCRLHTAPLRWTWGSSPGGHLHGCRTSRASSSFCFAEFHS